MTKSNNSNALNPFASIRSLRDSSLEAMSKAAIEAVNTETFAQWLGTYMQAMLTMSEPAQRMIDQSMQVLLPRFNLPSREELAVLGRRMTNIEMRLDDLDVRLDGLVPAFKAALPTPTAKAESDPAVETRLVAIEQRLDVLLERLGTTPAPAPKAATPRSARPSKPATPRRSTKPATEPVVEPVSETPAEPVA